MADWHAALPFPGARLMGSAQHVDSGPHRPGVVLRTGPQNGAAACLHQEDTEDTRGRSGIGYPTKKGDLMKKANNKKGKIGSSFDDFLKEDGHYEGVTARA